MGVHTRVTLGSRVYCNHNGCMCASYMLCIALWIMARQTILAVVLYSHQFLRACTLPDLCVLWYTQCLGAQATYNNATIMGYAYYT